MFLKKRDAENSGGDADPPPRLVGTCRKKVAGFLFAITTGILKHLFAEPPLGKGKLPARASSARASSGKGQFGYRVYCAGKIVPETGHLLRFLRVRVRVPIIVVAIDAAVRCWS
jgi:hypothetical protein